MERSAGTMGRQGFEGRPTYHALGWALAVLALLALVLLWTRGSGVSRRSLQGMPDAERQALYQRTVQNLNEVCVPTPRTGFEDFCRGQAGLVIHFPECDATCSARYGPLVPAPSR